MISSNDDIYIKFSLIEAGQLVYRTNGLKFITCPIEWTCSVTEISIPLPDAKTYISRNHPPTNISQLSKLIVHPQGVPVDGFGDLTYFAINSNMNQFVSTTPSIPVNLINSSGIWEIKITIYLQDKDGKKEPLQLSPKDDYSLTLKFSKRIGNVPAPSIIMGFTMCTKCKVNKANPRQLWCEPCFLDERKKLAELEAKKQVKTITNQPKIRLDDYKVPGLKELCNQHNLNTSKCKVRVDYVELLLSNGIGK